MKYDEKFSDFVNLWETLKIETINVSSVFQAFRQGSFTAINGRLTVNDIIL
ncbi:MAG: hypothetical protein M1407_04955 [Deltaproteobacteria bacterium]|nr:hypothetical protein [Deltaproteobacteria bacterium]